MNRIAILTGIIGIIAGAALIWVIAPGSKPGASAPVSATLGQIDDATFGARVRSYLLENPEVIFEAAEAMQQRQEEMQSASDSDLIAEHASAIFEDESSWSGGNPNGDITVVAFMDYECGYCRRAFPEVEELIASDGNIRVIIKEFPILGETSTTAARFAIAAQQVLGADAYKGLHDAMMTTKGDMAVPTLSRLAEALDLDAERIIAHMDSDEVMQVIAKNYALARALQISGTPAFVMQDRLMRGYLPLNAMQEIVKELRG